MIEKRSREEMEYLFFRLPYSPGKKRRLLERTGGVEPFFQESREGLQKLGLSEKEADWRRSFGVRETEWLKEYHRLEHWGIRFITERDREYPKRLLVLPDRPFGLLVRGTLPSDSVPSAALVGARNCSVYGKDMAEQAGKILAGAGVQVISGMALGIDGAGHRGALKAFREASGAAGTFAVLGSGCRVCYPGENRELFETVPSCGGILSEYGPEDPPEAWHFPMRNRLIAALADKIFVVEARQRSGSLITVDFALEQGKDVYAFPGRLTDPCSAGCNTLIQNGAGMITALEDLSEIFGMERNRAGESGNLQENLELGLATPEKLVYSCLDFNPKQEEVILEETGLNLQQAVPALLHLELRGLIKRSDGNYYRKA